MPHRALALSIFLFAIVAAGSSAWAQRGRVVSDQQIVQQAQLTASGGRVEIYQHGMQLYDSDHPERDIARLYGASREKLVRTAITGNP